MQLFIEDEGWEGNLEVAPEMVFVAREKLHH